MTHETSDDVFAALDVAPSESAAVSELHPAHHTRHMLHTAQNAIAFIRGGDATMTLVSKATDNRFTYRIRESADGQCLFVGLLNGPDNNADYKYLGRIARDIFWQGRKVPKPGDISRDAPSMRAFDWTWKHLIRGVMPDQLEIWHEGKCGRCGRKLTVPSSIESGFGPECANRLGF